MLQEMVHILTMTVRHITHACIRNLKLVIYSAKLVFKNRVSFVTTGGFCYFNFFIILLHNKQM